MAHEDLIKGRRSFIKGFSAIFAISGYGLNPFNIDTLTSSNNHGGMEVIDKELVFIDESTTNFVRKVPSEFVFSCYPATPSLPDVIEVDFDWKKEKCTKGVVKDLTRLGAINEGVYKDQNRILQIIASTPGTPDTSSGSPLYKNWYRISSDGGKSYSDFKLIITEEGSRMNPIKGVRIGRNGYTVPFTSPILTAANGEIMVPVNLHPWDSENHKIYNPADAFLFGDSGVLIGKWTKDGKDINWTFGNWLRINYHRSTRGLFEPSLAALTPNGKFAMVMRGSNYKRADLQSRAWLSFSDDYCRSWSRPEPLKYSDGEDLFVPASCSTLFRSVYSGVLYWIGNVTPTNPYGNHPRNPLIIGRIDENNFGLIKESITVIDHRHPEQEDENVELSNFKILTHPDLDEIIVALVRRVDGKWADGVSWYRIKLS